MGLISPVGRGLSKTRNSIKKGEKRLRPLSLFPVSQDKPLPVGEITEPFEAGNVPRTHRLALTAAREAMTSCEDIPDAVIMGVTTGGMLSTEVCLKEGETNPEAFVYHSAGSVAEHIAREFGCHGPAITISTACSSGTVAVKVALEMLRAGRARMVLAGGADSLSRLTYYGFQSLQLIDPKGSRPFDKNRRGMSVSEGAAMLILVASEDVPENAIAEILGAGLSCDAYHPSGPHPEGAGALEAIRRAIHDSRISLADIDYINLHGTGTIDNDLSEARALNTLFPKKRPLMSSIKGALGHCLGAAGAVEIVVSALTISENLVPANVGCEIPDPELRLCPVMEPLETADVQTVLSNSFGFGGNNASVVIGSPKEKRHSVCQKTPSPLDVLGSACLTGAGDTEGSLAVLRGGKTCQGKVPDSEITEGLPPGVIRRLKRLSRLTLALATAAHAHSGLPDTPSSIFFGTGWGALSETYDFLTKLFQTDEQFTSPTDFIGSVHNAPAGQVAIHFGSHGPNITTTAGDYSFEQALIVASLTARDIDDTMLLIAADESHPVLSGLFDRSVRASKTPSDGGGALCLRRERSSDGIKISPVFYENAENNPPAISSLVAKLATQKRINERYGAIFVGIPGGCRGKGEKQLREFLALSDYGGLVIDYRRFIGEFASASAVAAVLAIRFAQTGQFPVGLSGGKTVYLNGKDVLLVGFGDFVTAVEVIG